MYSKTIDKTLEFQRVKGGGINYGHPHQENCTRSYYNLQTHNIMAVKRVAADRVHAPRQGALETAAAITHYSSS